MNSVYLDYNATTPVEPQVLDAMLPYFSADFANASSIHTPGQRARSAVETAREQVAALIGARPQEVVFTSGGTESDNNAIFGVLNSHVTQPILAVHSSSAKATAPHIITTTIEHEAVQSAGKIPIDVNALNVDLLSLSGHKLYAPKGVGALYVRSGTRLRQLLYGGHHQRGFRPGTENVAGIVGLGKAADIARNRFAADAKHVSTLRDKLEHGLLDRVQQVRVNGGGVPRTPNTTNLMFSSIDGEALVIALDLKGLACSVGAACSSVAVEPSHVLTAIGLSQEEAKSSLRFSLGRHTTQSEIDFALEVVPAAVAHLRALSPTYQRAASHV